MSFLLSYGLSTSLEFRHIKSFDVKDCVPYDIWLSSIFSKLAKRYSCWALEYIVNTFNMYQLVLHINLHNDWEKALKNGNKTNYDNMFSYPIAFVKI